MKAKKFITFFLAIIMVFGTLVIVPKPAIPVSAAGNRFLAPIEPPVADSIPISTRAELEMIRNNLNGKYHLTADIDLSGVEWIPIGTTTINGGDRFSGIFDGQGHVVYNLKLSNSEYICNGLFGTTGGTIKNIGMEGIDINIISASSIKIGGICGYLNGGQIDNCYSSGSIIISTEGHGIASVGGICGSTINAISNSYNACLISVSSWDASAGGICGDGGGTYNNCYNSASIRVSYDGSSNNPSVQAGGICGQGGSFIKCHNSGSVTAYATSSSSWVGSGTPYISSAAGGICGSNGEPNRQRVIHGCYNTGDVLATSISAERPSWGNNASSQAGGISGSSFNCDIQNSYNSGSITSVASDVIDHWVTTSKAGGISGGINSTKVSDCYNSGDVFSSSEGYRSSTINSSNAGGICGTTDSNGYIESCVVLSASINAQNTTNPDNHHSALVTSGRITKTNNLALYNISGNAVDDSDGRITSDQAKEQSTYEKLSWDFGTVWGINPAINQGYPYLLVESPKANQNTIKIKESEPLKVDIGKTISLSAELLDERGARAANQSGITWSVSDSSIASISTTSGSAVTLTGKKAGKCTVTAKSPDGSADSREITVQGGKRIEIKEKGPFEINAGEELKFNAELYDEDGKKADVQDIHWGISSVGDEKVASLAITLLPSSSATVIGLKGGKCTVTAFAPGGISDSREITVKGTKIIIEEKGPFEINTGDTLKLTAKLLDENNKPLKDQSGIKWSVGDNKVLEIVSTSASSSGSTVTLKGLMNGKCVIAAKAPDGGSDTSEIVVHGIKIKILENGRFVIGKNGALEEGPFVIGVTETLILNAQLVDKNDDLLEKQSGIKWEIEGDKILEIVSQSTSSEGSKITLKGIRDGKCTVVAKSPDGSSDSREVNIYELASPAYMSYLYSLPFNPVEYIEKMMKDVKAVKDANPNQLEAIKRKNDGKNWDKFCEFFNTWIVEYGMPLKDASGKGNELTKRIHYFRNDLNRAPKTLGELKNEREKWKPLSAVLSIYHMYGDNGEYNIKFVAKNGENHEAIYSFYVSALTWLNPTLLHQTWSNSPLLDASIDFRNMATYNYVGPDNASGHELCDVNPWEAWGNIEGDNNEYNKILDAANTLKFINNVVWAHNLLKFMQWFYDQDTTAEIACPVDVAVYNDKGTLVGRIIDNVIDESIVNKDNIAFHVIGDTKYISFSSDDTYTFNLLGTDEGSMDFTIVKKDLSTDKVISEKKFNKVPLHNGKQMTTKVGKDTNVSDIRLFVTDGKQVLGEISESGNSSVTVIPFTDVHESDWFYDTVCGVYAENLMVGTSATTFGPRGNVTLAQAITMAARVHAGGDDSFKNAGGGNWYDVYVNYAIKNGIVRSNDFTNYNANATRAQMAYIFANVIPADKQTTKSSLIPPDVKESDKYGKEIYMLYRAGILNGSDSRGTFNPNNNITRAEAAAILLRVHVLLK